MKVSIVGLGWLGMPLALSLLSKGYFVVGSKTTVDGVTAATMSGVTCYQLQIGDELNGDIDDIEQLLSVDALVITLPARRDQEDSEQYIRAVQTLVDSALAYHVSRIIFLSSTSVYGDMMGILNEDSPLHPITPAAASLRCLEQWMHALPHTSVDILRLSGLVGDGRHPGRFLAGKRNISGAQHGVNLVHQDDVIMAIHYLLQQAQGGHLYNLCVANHPSRRDFYTQMSQQLGLMPPHFIEDVSRGKEIDGSRICNELGFSYRYSDLLHIAW